MTSLTFSLKPDVRFSTLQSLVSCGRRNGTLVEHTEMCSEVLIYPPALKAVKLSIMIFLAAGNQTRLTSTPTETKIR